MTLHDTMTLAHESTERPDERSPWHVVGALVLTLLMVAALTIGTLGLMSAHAAGDRSSALKAQLAAQAASIKTLQGQSTNHDSVSDISAQVSELRDTVNSNSADAGKADAALTAGIASLKKRLSTICDKQMVTNQISSWQGASSASGQTWYSELSNALMAACQPYSDVPVGD